MKQRQNKLPLFVYWDGGFSYEELGKIIHEHAGYLTVGNYMSFLDQSQEPNAIRVDNKWMFDRFNQIVETVNDTYYGFDLYGYDNYNYVEIEKDHSTSWHTKLAYNEDSELADTTNKLCVEMQLNLNEAFSGGNLLMNTVGEIDPFKIDNVPGRIIVYPAWHITSRTPVTDGTRKIISFIVEGPRFR